MEFPRGPLRLPGRILAVVTLGPSDRSLPEMAEAILQVVLDNLNSLIKNELGLLHGVEKEMEKLSSTLSTIQAVLEDAEEKQLKDKALQNWLRKLKDAAYEVDDLLDEYKTEASRLADDNKVHAAYLTCFRPNVLFHHNIGNRIKDAREMLDGIAEERIKFHLREAVADRRVEVRARRETGSVVAQPEVYGREEDKEKIVERLVKDVAGSDDISIYPIVGMGGLGKTTLAQLVFNDDRIKRHFEFRIWVFVFEDFNVRRLMTDIITSLGGNVSEAWNLDLLQRRLKDMLDGKRYLLVLDDVWNEDQEKWDQLKCTLTCGSKGSSVVVTTRLAKVASIVGTLPVYRLSDLSEDDCWLLFKQRAFGNDTEQPMNILAIAKEIVKKCKGVPLAAKTLGSLMHFKSSENEWLHVKDSELWNLPQEENSILPALRLSYANLPVELRQCFAFCAVFPKNAEIEKERLIHLWMANGFISSKGSLEAEAVGNEIFNELYWRSLIQDFAGDNGSTYNQIYKMHDLVHDLAQSIAGDECCITKAERPSDHLSRQTRHVTFTLSKDSFTIPHALYTVEFSRTLLIQPTYPIILTNSGEYPCDISKFHRLRALEFIDPRLTKLSPAIGKLKHLRYLDLTDALIKFLPKSLCSLWNLQILKLEGCTALRRLPHHMKRLKNLHHLYLNGCWSLTSMPPKLRQMTALKTLSIFIVGRKKGYRLDELQGLNLSGDLHIKHLERVGNRMDAAEANLGEKANLRRLFLSWESDCESQLQENSERVLQALEPHSNLESLEISGYNGINFPLWVSSPVLNNLVSVGLKNFNCLELPPVGKLPSLKYLKISGMKHVKYIDNYFHGEGVKVFQSLETLSISKLPSLEKLSVEQGRNTLPCLTRLLISECPNLTLPCLSSLTELRVHSCSEAFLHSIPNLNKLTDLSIGGNDKVMTLPDSIFLNLTSLQSLRMGHFTKLKALPTDLRSLNALKSLNISHCYELESLPGQGLRCLNSLESLYIEYCEKFNCLSDGLKHLTALQSLDLAGVPELVDFPEGFQHLVSLKYLAFYGQGNVHNPVGSLTALPETWQHIPSLEILAVTDFPNLTSLPNWLGNLTSLRVLRFSGCCKLRCLPASIKNLTNLQTLDLWGCPELEKRCKKETGEDWHKIAHIPFVEMFS
ncbi:hypothetical protein KPL71_022914 [Citrus sinensis]|uniref:Uncharacterized protein n=2 Tax=Citrus sinensis TaxID=2711 RepID=A0ACB8IG91_CITSI|nr:hypothetical protein KPL71_022914 [Citrus sinensis]